MAAFRKIPAAARKEQNYLRLQGMKVASVYAGRLARARRKELKRVLALARDVDDPDKVADIISSQLREEYLLPWWNALWGTVGLPYAKATARDLRQAKAAAEENIWLHTLRSYATSRAGAEIVSVTGTWKDSLVNLTRSIMDDQLGISVDRLTRAIYENYTGNLEEWQCRRIAQTEAMIGMADAGHIAAKTLDIRYTKTWCTSGLQNVRLSHQEADGIEVDEDDFFRLPGGLLLYPHDTSQNADASEIINCACACIRRPKEGGRVQEPVPVPEPVDNQEQRIQAMMNEMPQDLPEDVRRAIAENNIELEKALGIRKGDPMPVGLADMQHANPLYQVEFLPDPNGPYVNRSTGEHFIKNPKYKKQYTINCATCAPTYVLRLRGFDITALGNKRGSLNEKVSHGFSFNLWKNADGSRAVPNYYRSWMNANGYYQMTPELYRKFFEESCKEKGTYIVTIGWKGKKCGHATILERGADGILSYIEPQAYDAGKGIRRSIDELCNYGDLLPSMQRGVMRVDNKIFNTDWAGLFNPVKKKKK